MANPYYQMMNGRNSAPQMGGRIGNAMNQMSNMANRVAEIQAFMSNPMQYILQHNINMPQGALQNPYGTVQNLLNSGRLSQGDLNSYVATAQQLLSMMGK